MPEFTYRARNDGAWRARAQEYGIRFPDEPETRADDAGNGEGEPEHVSARHNMCVCGHKRRDHCTVDPMLHWPSSEGEHGYFFCITEHCECFIRQNGQSAPCPCIGFRASAAAIPKLKRPSANEFTPCARCGHEKGLHCKASRQKPKQDIYQGFRIHGRPYPCSHTIEQAYVCDTSHCAEVVRLLGTDQNGNELGEFCDCSKFVNPLLKRRIAKPRAASTSAKPRAPRKSKKAVSAGELFVMEVAQ